MTIHIEVLAPGKSSSWQSEEAIETPLTVEIGNHDLAIVIPIFNQIQLTKACVDSIIANTGPHHLILVDNGSASDMRAYLRLQNTATVVTLRKNLGFAGGVNAGLAKCDGFTNVIVLNNDTLVTKGWETSLILAARSAPDIGLSVACTNEISRGTLQYIPEAPKNLSYSVVFAKTIDILKSPSQFPVDAPTGILLPNPQDGSNFLANVNSKLSTFATVSSAPSVPDFTEP